MRARKSLRFNNNINSLSIHPQSLAFTRTHTHSLTYSLIHSLIHSHTHTHIYSLTHSLTLTHTHSLTLTLTHTHSHSLALSREDEEVVGIVLPFMDCGSLKIMLHGKDVRVTY